MKICTSGIPEANINRDAWVTISKEKEKNGSELDSAIVDNSPILDKQSNALAKKMFDDKVQGAMFMSGFENEGHFCRLISNWFKAEDEPGISASLRHKWRMELRAW